MKKTSDICVDDDQIEVFWSLLSRKLGGIELLLLSGVAISEVEEHARILYGGPGDVEMASRRPQEGLL